jgi:hypothetical protein
MAGASNYLESARLNWLKGTTFPSSPANTYAALFTTAPTDDSGSGAVEVSGNAYARVAIASSGWSAISGEGTSPGQISNSGTLNYPTPTGTGWGTVVAIGLYDASSGGNLLYWNTITSQAIAASASVSFAVGAVVITED